MATKQPSTFKKVKPAADAVADAGAVAQELAKVQADALAKTTGVTADAAAETLEAVAPVIDATPVVDASEAIIEAAEAAVTPAETADTPKKKDWISMATNFEMPNVVTDLNDRAKASFEKTQQFAADFGDFNKGNIEAVIESGKIAAKGFETLGQDAADYTRRSFEGMTAALKSLAAVKSPTDFFKLQSDYARSAFDAAVAQSSKNTEAMIKLAGDAAQPISSRFALAVEKVKAAA